MLSYFQQTGSDHSCQLLRSIPTSSQLIWHKLYHANIFKFHKNSQLFKEMLHNRKTYIKRQCEIFQACHSVLHTGKNIHTNVQSAVKLLTFNKNISTNFNLSFVEYKQVDRFSSKPVRHYHVQLIFNFSDCYGIYIFKFTKYSSDFIQNTFCCCNICIY